MTPLTTGAIALLAGALIGASVVVGAPVFALPIVAGLLAVILAGGLKRRRDQVVELRRFRERAKARPIEFTARDKQTTVESEI